MKEIVTYLTFDGQCRDAMTFYAEALNAQLHIMSVSECGQPESPDADRIMHAKLALEHGSLMASDTMSTRPFQLAQGNNFSVSLDCSSAEEQERTFHALKQDGKVTMELQDTFWGARFGMLTDKFGIHWMFNFDHPKA